MAAALGLLSFLVAVAYWPGIDGAATSTRWTVLAVGLWPFLLPTAFTAGHALVVAFIAWSAITFLWTPFPWDWAGAMAQLTIIGMAFWAGSACSNLRPAYVGLGLGVSISSAVAIAQVFGFTGIAQNSIPAGLFVNGNMMAEIAVLALVAALSERIWWLVPLLAPAAVLPIARGPLLALVVAVATVVPRRVTVALALAGAAIVAMREHPFASIQIRLDYWRDTVDGLKLFGHGAGSFFGKFADFATRTEIATERPDHAHNDFLEIAVETGAVGAALFGFLVVLVARSKSSTAKAVLVALLVESLFGFPLHVAATAFMGAVAAGHICRGRDQLCGFHNDGRARL